MTKFVEAPLERYFLAKGGDILPLEDLAKVVSLQVDRCTNDTEIDGYLSSVEMDLRAIVQKWPRLRQQLHVEAENHHIVPPYNLGPVWQDCELTDGGFSAIFHGLVVGEYYTVDFPVTRVGLMVVTRCKDTYEEKGLVRGALVHTPVEDAAITQIRPELN